MQNIEVTYTNLQRLLDKIENHHNSLKGCNPTSACGVRWKAERLAEMEQGFDVIYALVLGIKVQR